MHKYNNDNEKNNTLQYKLQEKRVFCQVLNWFSSTKSLYFSYTKQIRPDDINLTCKQCRLIEQCRSVAKLLYSVGETVGIIRSTLY